MNPFDDLLTCICEFNELNSAELKVVPGSMDFSVSIIMSNGDRKEFANSERAMLWFEGFRYGYNMRG